MVIPITRNNTAPASGRDAGDVVRPAVDPVHRDCQVLVQLVGQVLVHDAAKDRRLGRSVMSLEARGIAFTALPTERLLHGADIVATLAQGRLLVLAQFPNGGRVLGRQPVE